MSLDILRTISELVQGAAAAVALVGTLAGLYVAVRRRQRPQARFASNQTVRVSRSTPFTLSGTARNVEPGTLRLLCERLDDGIIRYRDCGQVVLTGQRWQHRISGSVGKLHEEVTFLLVHVTPTAADALRRQPEEAGGAVLHELPLPEGCQALTSIDVTIAFPDAPHC